MAKLKAENEKIKAENEKLKAEKKAVEEQEKREKAEKEKRLETLKVEFYKKASSPDTDALIHHVKNNNSRINKNIDELITTVGEGIKETTYYGTFITMLSKIKNLSLKSLKATDLILNCDLAKSDSQKINLPLFIEGYLKNEVHNAIKCHFKSSVELFAVIGSKLDLGLILDNFINNSVDWRAQNIWIECEKEGNKLCIDVYDDGDGLSDIFKNTPDDIFNFATSGKEKGTGYGMYLIKESLASFNATISIAEPVNDKGIHFKMIFN